MANGSYRRAHDLFHRRGFHAVGLDGILAEVGVTKTTFYNHFSSKDDLVAEVLRQHDRWWRDTFRERLKLRGGDSARAQLLAIFDVIGEMVQCGDYNGCYFINVAVQFPQPHDPAHLAAAQHKQSMQDIVREIAAYAGAPDPDRLAGELSLLMEGAYVTQQIMRDPAKMNLAKELAGELIERRLQPSS
ncbi:MAG: TetR/AcrR family transcriptional regulator [Planctomycetes bacterium]|nr:TetR/AcrR family transcriptional regulator [Planctomycetota bacterium]